MPLPTDRAAVDLLFEVLESPTGKIAGSLLSEYYGKQATHLIEANLLTPRGEALAAPSLVDFEDEPVGLTWSAEHDGFGYFSPAVGWVTVRRDHLILLGVNYAVLLAQMMVRFDRGASGEPAVLVPDVLWELGEFPLRPRGRSTPVWFARRLSDAQTWRTVASLAARRPPERVRVLLTSTPAARLSERALGEHLIVSVADVLEAYDQPAISPAILAARVDGTLATPGKGRLHLSPDGRVLSIDGEVINFRSTTQINIIRRLVEGFRQGRRFRFTELVDKSSTSSKALRQVFGATKWAALDPYLKTRDGLWGFEI